MRRALRPLPAVALLALASFVSASASESGPAAAPSIASIDSLAFLEGCWLSEENGRRIEELWTAPAGGTMLGLSRTVKGERQTGFEFLRIATHDGRLSYLAQPNGAPPVAFALTLAEPGRAAFENAEHDFPKRIEYRRSGDVLRAELSGPPTERESAFAIEYRRVACSGRS